MQTERKALRITRPFLTKMIEDTELATGRFNTGKHSARKWFKVSHARGADHFVVNFYGFSAYIALVHFEKKLKDFGLTTSPIETGKDKVASVAVVIAQ